ncbi:MurR/RpiR family transcriptional regulator [Hungatella hathewayi]|uniref:MurR/RpiR family transcriptional regulator n=1 Tax=Hungatella hathewayi TaxID=154046 RepID=UPI00039D5B19
MAVLNSNEDDDTNLVLARYLLEHFHELKNLSIYDVAEECYVSRSSIQRFAKLIGYESFTAMKQNAPITRQHMDAFVQYACHPEFDQYLRISMDDMMQDLNEMFLSQNLDALVKRIHDSEQVVILAADLSSYPAKVLQQGLAAIGKLIRIVTDAYPDTALLQNLKPEDLVIVTSTTGNYAIATLSDLQSVHACKVLITLNHSEKFESCYDSVIYLSHKFHSSDRITEGIQNVYTRYGVSYFFDLLFNLYIEKVNTLPSSHPHSILIK